MPRELPVSIDLVAAYRAAGGGGDPDELGPVLARAVATARSAGLALDPLQLVAHVARHAPRPAAIAKLRVVDLGLALACAGGDRVALERLRRSLADATSMLRRRGLSAAERDEVVQRVSVKLLTSTPPRILDYAGAGELASWLRVAALREAHNMRRETHREDPLGDADLVEAVACTAHSPGAAQIARESRDVFVAAFRAAFATLSARERNMMRMHYVDRVELQDLATAYGVHRVTAGRWLDGARERLCGGVERRLAARLNAGTSEVGRLIELVRGGPDLSLGRLLATVTGAP